MIMSMTQSVGFLPPHVHLNITAGKEQLALKGCSNASIENV